MSDPNLQYDPVTGFNDASVFVTNPATQSITRTLLQRLFTQVQIFINTTLIAWINSTFATKIDITTNRKLSATGDFTGTILGLQPIASDPYLSTVVAGHTAQLADNATNVKQLPFPYTSAKGDGITDDTVSIQNAIDYVSGKGGGTVLVPTGIYMINVVASIVLKNNITLLMDKNTILKAIPTSVGGYVILRTLGANNVSIIGGNVVGERYEHFDEVTKKTWKMWEANTSYNNGDLIYSPWFMSIGYKCTSSGTTGAIQPMHSSGTALNGTVNLEFYRSVTNNYIGEAGSGVEIWGTNIIIRDLKVRDCWGDGFYIGIEATDTVLVDNVVSDNNRRQGMSVYSPKNVIIQNSTFSNTNGTAPSSGIDIEPISTLSPQNILIKNCKFVGNYGSGIQSFIEDSLRPLGENIKVIGCDFINNKQVDPYVAVDSTGLTIGDCSIDGLSNFKISDSSFKNSSTHCSAIAFIGDTSNCIAIDNDTTDFNCDRYIYQNYSIKNTIISY